MTLLSKSITGLGLLFLAHACYSAHEHSALQSIITSSTSHDITSSLPISGSGPTSLPLDITIETVVSLVVVCVGLVMGMQDLRPIVWRVWAGGIERGGEGVVGDNKKDFVGNPFRVLESRPGFVDVRKQRGEFMGWVKEGGEGKS